ncbi:MAG: biotin--[acetyl-CoA-carboxylase] ligase [Bacteroidales bacterium]|nr:biotin--[acetyl-CoA-carboxylase] ligase [Bacteroidales bacterium]
MNNSIFTIVNLPQVDSTNNYAANLLKNMSAEQLCNTVVQADFQTNGRGAFKNLWESNAQKNLLFSIIICPKVYAENQFVISKIVSLSIIDYLKSKNISAKIKWPNDILVNNEKIAGILIENSVTGHKISSSIIGIGLNVNQHNFFGDFKASSISLLSNNQKFNLKKELMFFLDFFKKWINFCSIDNQIIVDKAYFENLLGSNTFLNYREKNTEFQAKIISIDGFGRLVLETAEKEQKIFAFKEVELIL